MLLVKHSYLQGWYLPGGGVKKGESIEEAARREAFEEVGAKLDSLHLLGIYTNFYGYKSDHVIVFSCNSFTITGETDSEIERFDFFDFDKLPQHISPGSLRRIDEYRNQNTKPVLGMW